MKRAAPVSKTGRKLCSGHFFLTDEEFASLSAKLARTPVTEGGKVIDEFLKGIPRFDGWKGYTEGQLGAIRQAIPAPVSDDRFNDEIHHFLEAIRQPDEWRVRDVAKAARDVDKELEQDRDAIERALAVLAARANRDSDWHDRRSLVGNRAAIAEAFLHAFLDALDRERRVNEDYGTALDAIPAGAVSNNFRPFQDRLLKATATFWQRMGGTINYKKNYRAFFEAVVMPVVSSPSIMRRHGVAWSDGMFHAHVAKENLV
jgi:hypothetical protein